MHLSLLVAPCAAPLSLQAARAVGRPARQCEITPPDYPEPEGNTYPQLLALAMECAKEAVEGWDAAMARAAGAPPEDRAVVMAGLQTALGTPDNLLVQQALQAGMTRQSATAMRKLLAKHGSALLAARELLAGPCLQQRGTDDDERIRQMTAFRQVARLMVVQARALQHRGDHDGALECLVDLLRLGEVLSRNAPLIPALVGVAVLGMAAHALPGRIHDPRTSDDALAGLAVECRERWEGRVPATEALALNWLELQEASEAARQEKRLPAFAPLRRLGMWCWGRFEAREQAALCHVIELAKHPRWERKPDERLFRRTIAAESYLAACDKFDHRDAILARLRLQVAIEQHRRAQGAPPSELRKLAPDFIGDIPVDPFTGDLLHYELRDDGYRLYSRAETEGGVAWRGTEPEEYKW